MSYEKQKLTEAQMNEMIIELKAIGNHEKDGFVFVVTSKVVDKDIAQIVNRGYVNNVPREMVISAIAEALKMSGLEAMLVLSDSSRKVDGK